MEFFKGGGIVGSDKIILTFSIYGGEVQYISMGMHINL